PAGPVAVAVYSTDLAGVTFARPFNATGPTSGSIRTLWASRASHSSTAGCPDTTTPGLAVSVMPGRRGTAAVSAATTRSTFWLAVPPGPFAVATYVTDFLGVTVRDPLVGTSPMPGS